MADENTAGAEGAPAETNANVLVYTVPGTGGDGEPAAVTRSLDLATIPPETRLALLKNAVGTTINNRVNVTNSRYNVALKPFIAYDEAMKADPLQTAVAKPEGERPAAPDLTAKVDEAIADLVAGKLRERGKSGAKPRQTRSPLVAAVTPIVVRAVFDANKAANASYKYPDAVKEVGGDGIAYLNAQIDAKVNAAPADAQAELRKQLEKSRDTRFINPAKVMIGETTTKASDALPSIL